VTALLSCDGCGDIVSARPDDEDPTATWWSLIPSPMIGGGLAPIIMQSFDEALDPDPVMSTDLDRPEPDRHFCTLACLAVWIDRVAGT
jgi:hypothetical protein